MGAQDRHAEQRLHGLIQVLSTCQKSTTQFSLLLQVSRVSRQQLMLVIAHGMIFGSGASTHGRKWQIAAAALALALASVLIALWSNMW